MISEHDLWNSVKEDYSEKIDPLETLLQNVTDDIMSILRQNDIKCTSKYRVKERESYFSKLQAQHKNSTAPQELNDLLGMRIVVHFIEEVDRAVELISEKYEVIEKEIKSDSLSFREFSYDSTHILISSPDKELQFVTGNNPVVEIQVRTTLQDAWAEVEHELIYKSNVQYHSELIKRKMAALNASLTLSDIIFQEIKEYQKDMIENKKQRSRKMQEKLSSLSDEEYSVFNDTQAVPIHKSPGKKVESIVGNALRAHSAGDYKASIELYAEAIALSPSSQVLSIIHNHRGMAYFMCSEYEEALKCFTRAIEFNEENDRAYGNRAIIHKLYKDYDNAILDFTQSLEIKHNQPEILMLLSKTYFEDNQLTKALQTVNLVLDITPSDIQALNLHNKISRKLIP